jgi:hypothetical protein
VDPKDSHDGDWAVLKFGYPYGRLHVELFGFAGEVHLLNNGQPVQTLLCCFPMVAFL